jgi:hypothetical protein
MEEEGEGGREGFRLHVEPQEADGQVHLQQINRQLYNFTFFIVQLCTAWIMFDVQKKLE